MVQDWLAARIKRLDQDSNCDCCRQHASPALSSVGMTLVTQVVRGFQIVKRLHAARLERNVRGCAIA